MTQLSDETRDEPGETAAPASAGLADRVRETLATGEAKARSAAERHASVAVPFRAMERNQGVAASVLAGGLAYRLFLWLLPFGLDRRRRARPRRRRQHRGRGRERWSPRGGRRRDRGHRARGRLQHLVAPAHRRAAAAVGGLHRGEGAPAHPRARLGRATAADPAAAELAPLLGRDVRVRRRGRADVVAARLAGARVARRRRGHGRSARSAVAPRLAAPPARDCRLDGAPAGRAPRRDRLPGRARAGRLSPRAQARDLDVALRCAWRRRDRAVLHVGRRSDRRDRPDPEQRAARRAREPPHRGDGRTALLAGRLERIGRRLWSGGR